MRICESGAPECTGVNPCTSCFKRITTIVMPIAMRAGGIADDRKKSAAFFKEYGNGWQWMLSQVSQLVVAAHAAKMQASGPMPPQPGFPGAQQPGFPVGQQPGFPGAQQPQQPPSGVSMDNVAPIRPRDREESRDVTARPPRNVRPVDRGAGRVSKKPVERGEIKRMAREQAETPPVADESIESLDSDLSSTTSADVLDLTDPADSGTGTDKDQK